MWHHWAFGNQQRSRRPQLWWKQVETTSRTALPFGHLFPRPPDSRRPSRSEAQELVETMVQSNAPQGRDMEAAVQRYMSNPASTTWEPVEAWQVLSIHRINEAEPAEWGADGNQVLEWFDRGDLVAWPLAPDAPNPEHAPPSWLTKARMRLRAWLRHPEELELLPTGS